jgi:putative transposase
MKLLTRRRSIRLQNYDYSQPGAYFVTICTHKKRFLFGQIANGEMHYNKTGYLVQSIWEYLPVRFPAIQLDTFIVMPNHIHGIITIGKDRVGVIHELPLPKTRLQRRRMLLPKINGYFKMNTAKRVNKMHDTRGTKLWQRNYYEHVIRNEDELLRTRKYILNNPARWFEDPDNPIHTS